MSGPAVTNGGTGPLWLRPQFSVVAAGAQFGTAAGGVKLVAAGQLGVVVGQRGVAVGTAGTFQSGVAAAELIFFLLDLAFSPTPANDALRVATTVVVIV